jgi:Fur family ferric uptake transcriptional regulator
MKSENPPPVRLTPQRRRILDILKESGGHLDADTLYRKAKDRNSRISLATVYRTLALFRDAKMIREHRLGGSHAHFEPAQDALHYHCTCLECGRVIEFRSPKVKRAVDSFCRR